MATSGGPLAADTASSSSYSSIILFHHGGASKSETGIKPTAEWPLGYVPLASSSGFLNRLMDQSLATEPTWFTVDDTPGVQMTLEEQFETFLRKVPTIGRGAFVARGAVVIGDVTVGDHSSVWFNAVLRADLNRIVIGHHSNIQDTCVLHVADDYPCLIGNHVTVGHGAVVHASTIGDGSLIGMGSVVLDGAVIGQECLIGAKSLVSQFAQIPDGSLVLGAPAKVERTLTSEECKWVRSLSDKYVRAGAYYRTHGIGADGLSDRACRPAPGVPLEQPLVIQK